MDRETLIWQYLQSRLNNPYGTAGLMGNLYAESALNPQNLQNSFEKSLGYTDQEYTKVVDNGTYNNFVNDKAGYGLAQWTYWSRKQNLYNFAKANNKSIGDLDMQLEFLWKELQEYKAVFETLKKATSVREASDCVLTKFERPADQSETVQKKRASYGQTYFDKFTKESDTMAELKIIDSMLTKNPCYQANVNKADNRYIEFQNRGPVGGMLHSVGCPQPSASVFVKNWNSESYDRACVHGFIDANTGDVHQTLPWNFRGWHGGGSSNNTHFGVEMCEPDCIKYTGGSSFETLDKERAVKQVKRTYESAVLLFAKVFKQYNLDPMKDGVLVSHKEGCARGIASNHGDPEHLWKGLGLPYTMDTFRKDVKAAMEGSSEDVPSQPEQPQDKNIYRVQVGAFSVKAYADEQLKKVKAAGFTDAFITQVNGLYKVQVGAYTVKTNAENMLAKVKAKGFDAFITAANKAVQSEPTKPALKSVDEIAKEVIAGKWGNGTDRKNRLEAAGYNYSAVQKKVNELLK